VDFGEAQRVRYLWPLVAVLGVFAYLYSAGGLYVPHIGDEAPYIEIARLTAESSHWLPLRTAPGLENTKPPLLFWAGIAATDWGRTWTLERLRAPVVLSTLATALVVFWLARKLGFDRETAWLGALTYIGFYSTFQYGRPFLTNSPETLFAFTSFALVLGLRDSNGGVAPRIGSGIALGVACLFKSFALVAPVGAALAWLVLAERGLDRALLRVALVVSIGLAVFALWPILDPEPFEVIRHFVVEENLGKLQGEGYLRGLFAGPYALQWLWLGHFAHAGLFALPLLVVVVSSVRGRRRLSREERALWMFVLAFLAVYSVPSQRQENYLLPTVPALALLLAVRWRSFPDSWFRWFSLPGAVLGATLLHVVSAVRKDVLPEGSYAAWQIAALWLLPALWIASALYPRAGRYSFHALVFAAFFTLSVALAPFEGPLGRFAPERVAFLSGERVFVPTEFISRHERHRFLLPGARIEGYDPNDADSLSQLLESGQFVVVHRTPGESILGPFRPVARRFDLRTRQTKSEMWRIAVGAELDLLVREELVIRRYRMDRLRRRPPSPDGGARRAPSSPSGSEGSARAEEASAH
jgi:4-amino-4-deoxy-L-arabinose transferase-like glycosyltransferase